MNELNYLSFPHVSNPTTASNFMLDIYPAIVYPFMHGVHALKEAIQADTAQDAQHHILYIQWTDFYSTLLLNHYLQYPYLPQVNIIQLYINIILNSYYIKQRM